MARWRTGASTQVRFPRALRGFTFPSMEALQAAHAAPGIAEVGADIAKFTDITPVILIGKSD